jgi:hypothetical protein
LFLILPKAALSLLKKASAIIRSYENVASLSAAKPAVFRFSLLACFLRTMDLLLARRESHQCYGRVIEKPDGNWRVQPNLLSYERTYAEFPGKRPSKRLSVRRVQGST